jgi:hypothetical protein
MTTPTPTPADTQSGPQLTTQHHISDDDMDTDLENDYNPHSGRFAVLRKTGLNTPHKPPRHRSGRSTQNCPSSQVRPYSTDAELQANCLQKSNCFPPTPPITPAHINPETDKAIPPAVRNAGNAGNANDDTMMLGTHTQPQPQEADESPASAPATPHATMGHTLPTNYQAMDDTPTPPTSNRTQIYHPPESLSLTPMPEGGFPPINSITTAILLHHIHNDTITAWKETAPPKILVYIAGDRLVQDTLSHALAITDLLKAILRKNTIFVSPPCLSGTPKHLTNRHSPT